MKIDFVLNYLAGRGGLEKAIKLVINELVARGHIVRIFVTVKPKYPDFEEGLAIKVIQHGLFYEDLYKNDTEYDIRTIKIIYENTYVPDVMIATHIPAMCYVCRGVIDAMSLKNTKLISWVHWSAMSQSKQLHFHDLADGAMTLTDSSKKLIRGINEIIPIKTVGNPFEFNEIETTKEYSKYPLNKHNLFMVGRIDHNKNIEVGCKIPVLDNSYTMNIYGSGTTDTNKYIMRHYPEVNMNGWIDDPIGYHIKKYKERGILIFPSYNESFGYVILEAISRGCLVLSTATDGAKQLINENNGMIFDGLEDLLEKLDSINPNDYNFEAIRSNVNQFETSKVVDSMLEFIDEV